MANGSGESPVIGAPSMSSYNARNRDPNGLVLAFDMDATLIDTTDEAMKDLRLVPSLINARILDEVIVPAAILRLKGIGVSAIFMLTNNGYEPYISRVSNYISDYTRRAFLKKGIEGRLSDSFFDYTMTRNTAGRPADIPKRLEDVALMMREVGLATDNLPRRTFMFDDLPEHVITGQISPGNYIHIVSTSGTNGFTVKGGDGTNYSNVTGKLREVEEPNASSPSSVNWRNALGGEGGSLRGGRRRRRFKEKSRKLKYKRNLLKKRGTYRNRQRGAGQYCAKKIDGKTVDYIYCSAQCSSDGTDGTCEPYS